MCYMCVADRLKATLIYLHKRLPLDGEFRININLHHFVRILKYLPNYFRIKRCVNLLEKTVKRFNMKGGDPETTKLLWCNQVTTN